MKKNKRFKFIVAMATLNLMGCSVIGGIYDRADDCQTGQHLNRPQGYTPPDWCGANSGRKYIYGNQGQRMGYIK